MIYHSNQYHRSLLTRQQQENYDAILAACGRFVFDIPLPRAMAQKRVMEVVTALRFDNPLLFYVDFYHVSLITGAGWMNVRLQPTVDPDVARRFLESALSATRRTADELCAGMNGEAGKFRRLHDYVAGTLIYQQNSNPVNDCFTIIGPLTSRKAVCEGYAKYYKLLCDQAGLSCIVVSGSAKLAFLQAPQPHSWNMVHVGPKFRHVDTTWDSCRTLFGSPLANDAYFMVRDTAISKTHEWDRRRFPRCN